MPKPITAATKPAGRVADRVGRLHTPKTNDDECDPDLRQQVREQATLLQELVSNLQASEDLRLLTTQRNKKLAKENKHLKDDLVSILNSRSFQTVAKKEFGSSPRVSTGEVSTLSANTSSITSSSSIVTLTKGQMSELVDSVAALKEVAFRRDNTWQLMARKQLTLQKQITMLKDAAKIADRQLRDCAQTIKDQAAALKKDQATIASLKRQSMNRQVGPQRMPSVVEVMAPPNRRPHRPSAPGDVVIPKIYESPGSRGGSRREHHCEKRDRYADKGHVVEKIGLGTEKTGQVVDKEAQFAEKAEHYTDKSGHHTDNKVHLSDRREEGPVRNRGTSRRTSESASALKQKRVALVGGDDKFTL